MMKLTRTVRGSLAKTGPAWIRMFGVACAALCVSISATAQGQSDQDIQDALQAAEQGPMNVRIFDQAKIDVPEECKYLPAARAKSVIGDFWVGDSSSVIGVLIPAEEDLHPWLIAISFERLGCVRSTDTAALGADSMLSRYKAFNTQVNRARSEDRVVSRWQWQPFFDSAGHRLLWGAATRERDDRKKEIELVDAGAVALGRDGCVMLSLHTSATQAAGLRPLFERLQQAVSFVPGKRFEDFEPAKDVQATCTLADLVVRECGIVKGPKYTQPAYASATNTRGQSDGQSGGESFGGSGGRGSAESQARGLAAQRGPRQIDVAGGGQIMIPKGYLYLPKGVSQRVLSERGGPRIRELQGLIVAEDERQPWLVTICMQNCGFVRDDQNQALPAEEILSNLKKKRADGALQAKLDGAVLPEVVRWTMPPRYDPARRVMKFGLVFRDARGGGEETVNLQSMTLGRRASLNLTIIAPVDQEAAARAILDSLTSNTVFNEGNRYSDFDPARDQVSPMSLATVITGMPSGSGGGSDAGPSDAGSSAEGSNVGGSLSYAAGFSQAMNRILKWGLFAGLPVLAAVGVACWAINRKTAA